MIGTEIARKHALTRDAFTAEHLPGAGRPVVIIDAIDRWPAKSKWTFDFFTRAYGSDVVMAPAGIGSSAALILKLGTYVELLDRPATELSGFWIDTRSGSPLDAAPVNAGEPYLTGWGAFDRHPELLDDISAEPYFIEDWASRLSADQRAAWQAASGREYLAIYLGRAGTFSDWHQDWWSTYSCLTQIAGRKQVSLHPPDDHARTTPYECVIGPGDTLFIPPGWWHAVRSLDHTITFSRNFFNRENIDRQLPHVRERSPQLAAAFESLRRP